MGSIVVSIWSRSPLGRERELNQRLTELSRAVETCAKQIARQGFPADGLIRGIFVAPEYYLSRTCAGFKLDDGTRVPRQILSDEKDTVVAKLLELSRRWPRILILPGTVAWERPKDLAKIQRRLRYYEHRRGQTLRKATLEALRKCFRVSVESALFVTPKNIEDYWLSNGRPPQTRELNEHDFGRLVRALDPTWLEELVDDVVTQHPAMNFLSSGSEIMQNGKLGASRMMFNTAYGMLNGRLVLKYHKQANFNEEAGQTDLVFVPGAKSGIYEIEGVRIGLEICLDHGVGSTRWQARESRPIDIQVIQSDYVEYEPANAAVKPGGYLVHASTHPDHNYVWRQTPKGFVHAPGLGSDPCAGDVVGHYAVEVNAGDAFDLSGSFMSNLPGRDPQKWATVKAPGNTFRTRG